MISPDGSRISYIKEDSYKGNESDSIVVRSLGGYTLGPENTLYTRTGLNNLQDWPLVSGITWESSGSMMVVENQFANTQTNTGEPVQSTLYEMDTNTKARTSLYATDAGTYVNAGPTMSPDHSSTGLLLAPPKVDSELYRKEYLVTVEISSRQVGQFFFPDVTSSMINDINWSSP